MPAKTTAGWLAKVKEELGDEAGSLPQTAIRFALMNPRISGVLVGFSKLTHIDQSIAVSGMPPLPEGVMLKLTACTNPILPVTNSGWCFPCQPGRSPNLRACRRDSGGNGAFKVN
jgi:predicted aldo/keto reductase-like oxidoreductase